MSRQIIQITGGGIAVILGFGSLIFPFLPGNGIGFLSSIGLLLLGVALIFLGVR